MRGVAADGHGKSRVKDTMSPDEAIQGSTPQYLVSVVDTQNYG